MSVVIFRNGVPLQTPANYASQPAHRALVEALSTHSYSDAVLVLERAPADSWLAADVLSGADWARRYLASTALLWAKGRDGRKMAARGSKALWELLAGIRPRVGRRRTDPLSPELLAVAMETTAAWRVLVSRFWTTDRGDLETALVEAMRTRFVVSSAHRAAARSLCRRKRLRRPDVVLAAGSWEMGFSLRPYAAQKVADLVYG